MTISPDHLSIVNGPGPWSRAEKAAFTLFVVAVLSSLLLFVHPWYDARRDASMYIVTARALAEGHGYTYLGVPFRIRPPGFPAMIVPIIRVLGTNFLALNLLVSLIGAAGVVLLYLHQRTRVGWILGLLTASAVWLNPGYQKMCNRVMSDVPGLALLFCCLLLDRSASREPSWRREIALGMCIGVSAYVRTAILLVLPAIIVSRMASRVVAGGQGEPWRSFAARRLALPAMIACIVVLPWSVRNARNAPPPPADQTANYSIATAMWHKDAGDPGSPRYSAGEILSRPLIHALPIAGALGSRMQLQVPVGAPALGVDALHVAVALLLIACLLIVVVRRRAPAEIFAAGMLLVVASYFTFEKRLVIPVYVIAFSAMVEVLADLLRRTAGARVAALAAPALLLLLIAHDFEPRQNWGEIEEKHRAYAAIAASLKPGLQEDARLGSFRGFHHSVYLERPVYSLIHSIGRAGRVDAVEELIDKYGINTILLSPLDPQDRTIAPYFQQRYGSGMKAASALVWRVRPPIEPRRHGGP